MLETLDFLGNPYLGVHGVVSDHVAILPPSLPKRIIATVAATLDVEVVRTTVSQSMIIGTLACLNEHGMIVTNFIEPEELEKLKRVTEVTVIDDKFNAAGNNILVNNKGALVHPEFSPAAIKAIEDALDVEVVRGRIAGLATVGAAAVATEKGLLCHPKITPEEREVLEALFGVPTAIGTANYGVPLVGACMLANATGAVVGDASTGIELGRIEDALELI